MKVRQFLFPLMLLAALAAAGLGSSGRFAGAALQGATPAATSPAATPATAASPVADASPVAEPTKTEAPAAEPVTLAFSYAPDKSGDFLNLVPARVDGLVLTAGDPESGVQTQVDFDSPRNNDLPWIRYGNNVFEAYAVFPDDASSVQRWIYYNDDPEQRPSTLVLQITCVRGQYDGYAGTATFISRGGEIGGTLIIALDPPAAT